MAEAKPWSDLEGAFEDFWRWFEFDFWRSLLHMRVHCKKVVDKRFPERFLDQFVTNVEKAKWSVVDDPHGEVPKKIMDDMIKSLKAFYDVPECEEVPKEEIMDVEELTPEQIEENIEKMKIMDVEELTPEQIEENIEKMKIMDVEELTPEQIEENIEKIQEVPKEEIMEDVEELTPEQIEENIENMKKKFDKSAKSRSMKRGAVNAKAKADRESRKDEKQLQQAENLAKNCLKKKK